MSLENFLKSFQLRLNSQEHLTNLNSGDQKKTTVTTEEFELFDTPYSSSRRVKHWFLVLKSPIICPRSLSPRRRLSICALSCTIALCICLSNWASPARAPCSHRATWWAEGSCFTPELVGVHNSFAFFILACWHLHSPICFSWCPSYTQVTPLPAYHILFTVLVFLVLQQNHWCLAFCFSTLLVIYCCVTNYPRLAA